MQAIQPGKYEPSTLNEGECAHPVNVKTRVAARLAATLWLDEHFSGLVFSGLIFSSLIMDGPFGMLSAADRRCDRQGLRALSEVLFARRHHY